MRNRVREGVAGCCRRDGEVRDGDNYLEVSGFEANRAYALGGEIADDEAAQQRGGGVVGVPVELADEVE